MGFLDDISAKLGGQKGQDGGMASLQRMFNDNGGLHGMTAKLTDSGLGRQVQSWVGTGENQPISGSQVQQAMDPDKMHHRWPVGGPSMSDEEACQHVAQALPEMVDQATPQGKMPDSDPFSKGMDAVKRMFKM